MNSNIEQTREEIKKLIEDCNDIFELLIIYRFIKRYLEGKKRTS